MASASEAKGIEVPGLSLAPRRGLLIGSLRYFDAQDVMAANLGALVGGSLPGPGAAIRHPIGSAGEIILAWRSPTESFVITGAEAVFAQISQRAAADRSAGYLVDQTGGFWIWELGGPRARDLLLRLGSAASIPAVGEARTSRIAELPVLAASVRPGTFLLVVERVLSEHLLAWIAETVADL